MPGASSGALQANDRNRRATVRDRVVADLAQRVTTSALHAAVDNGAGVLRTRRSPRLFVLPDTGIPTPKRL